MDPYTRRVDEEMATESGRACIWFVIRRRLLSSSDRERLISEDPLRADELAAKRVTAMCKTARLRTGHEATLFVRAQMLERARWQFSTTEIDTIEPGTFAASMLDDFDGGAWD